MIVSYMIILAAALLLIPFLRVTGKGLVTLVTVIAMAGISSIMAIQALLGDPLDLVYTGTLITGRIPVVLDALSAWFILIINFTVVTGALYGLQYMKAYRTQSANISMHCLAYLLMHSMLLVLTVVQNSLVFLIALEVMALSAFVLVIFEHYKAETLRAGLNYFVQSHLSIVFLSIGFLWVASHTQSYDFSAITTFSVMHPVSTTVFLFVIFFIGFAFKAGFVPFHTWLPYAHPAAPSHISGVMSGVIIKIGIYGLLRMILLIHTDLLIIGTIILIISLITGVYGIMLAILQKNLKKLLAYSSIENIGIIGIGIGVGTIGLGINNYALCTLGFAGGLLHVLNHSLFKSMLFYGAGNVYQATHGLNMERLGGLIKRMPHSALLLLVASLAICGLPPFNGFVSEFLIYTGLFNGLTVENSGFLLLTLASVFGLVMIGGLAFLCFTKAYSIVFLGNARSQYPTEPLEVSASRLIPMYMILALMIAIGLFPQYFILGLDGTLQLFNNRLTITNQVHPGLTHVNTLMQNIAWPAGGFILLAAVIFFIRKRITSNRPVTKAATWGCGYTGETSRMQYSASSFIRSYRKLAGPVIDIRKKKTQIHGTFPTEGSHETAAYDKVEAWLIDRPLRKIEHFFHKFSFLQNGKTQYYVLYGVVFILLVTAAPYVYEAFLSLIAFFKGL